MIYGELLKKLIVFTNTKMAVLARETGYDISYISKWCNKGLLPTPRTIAVINKKLAKVFAKEVIAQERFDDFFFEFDDIILKVDDNYDDYYIQLAENIETALNSSYRLSSGSEISKSSSKAQDEIPSLSKKQVLEDIIKKINYVIKNSVNDVEVLWTVDICKSLKYINVFDKFAKNPNIKVTFHIALDIDEFNSNSNYYIKQLYTFLARNNTVFFEFYNGKNLKYANVIAVKNSFAVLTSISSDGYFDFGMNITEEDDVSRIYSFFSHKFKAQSCIIHACTSEEMTKKSYRTDFYSRTKFNFFITTGFEFLLPSEIIDNIVETAKKQTGSDNIEAMIRNLQITWEEIFEKREITFFVLSSSVLKYITNGEIFYTDVIYNLTVDERLAHLQKIIDISKRNPKIRFAVIDDESVMANEFSSLLSVFANDKKAFLKNHEAYRTGIGPNIYTINNKYLINSINEFAEATLERHTICQEYDSAALEKMLDEYGTMVYRLMNIGI